MIVREFVTMLGFDVDKRDLRVYEQALIGIERRAGNMYSHLQGLGNQIRNFGLGLTATITAPLIALGTASTMASARIESARVKYQTLLGGVAQGNKLFDELLRFEKESPLTLESVLGGAESLLQYNYAMEEIVPTMKMIGDITGGNAEMMSRISWNLAQIRGSNRATTIDLRQFANAAVPIYDALEKTTGKSRIELDKMVSEGKIGYAEVLVALQSLTTEGGRFYGNLQKQSLTLGGRLSTLNSSFFKLRTTIGDILAPGVKKIVEGLIKIFDRLNNTLVKMPKPLKFLVLTFALLGVVIPPLITMYGILLSLTIGMIAAQTALAKANLTTSKAVYIYMGSLLMASKAMVVFIVKMIGSLALLIATNMTTSFSFLAMSKAILVATLSMLKLTAVFLTNPITLIILGIVAAITLLIFVLNDLWVWASGGKSIFGKLFGDLDMAAMISAIDQTKKMYKDFFTNLWKDFLDAPQTIWNALKKILDGIIEYLKFSFDGLKSILNPIIDKIQELFEFLKNPLAPGSWLSKLIGFFGRNQNANVNVNEQAAQFQQDFRTGRNPFLSGDNPSFVNDQTGRNTSRSLIVQANINAYVPEGTPEAQRISVQETARSAAEEIFNAEIDALLFGVGG